MSEDPSSVPRRKKQISQKTQDRVEGLFEFSSITREELSNFLRDNGYESNLVVREGKIYAKMLGLEEYTPLNDVCNIYADQSLGDNEGRDYYIARLSSRYDNVCRQAIREGASKGIEGASDAILEAADERAEEARVETSLFSSLSVGDRRELLAYQMQIALLQKVYPEEGEQLPYREINKKLYQANNKIQEVMMRALELEQQEIERRNLEPSFSSLHRAEEFEEKAKALWQQFRNETLEPSVQTRVAEVAADESSFDTRGNLRPEAEARLETNIMKDSSFGFMTFIHGCAAITAGLVVGALATIPGALIGACAGVCGVIGSGMIFVSLDMLIGAAVVGAAAGALAAGGMAGYATAASVFESLEKEYPADKTMTSQYQQQVGTQQSWSRDEHLDESHEPGGRKKPSR